VDIRDIGLVGAVELAPRDGAPGARGYDVFRDCFEAGVLVRQTGDIIALAPPLIVERDEIDRMTETLAAALRRVA
jgi:beta-alanine--pyruvate transaminase